MNYYVYALRLIFDVQGLPHAISEKFFVSVTEGAFCLEDPCQLEA